MAIQQYHRSLKGQSAPQMGLRALTSVADIAAGDWDRLANPAGQPFNPFVSHAFFKALEESGSATRETGWLGQHLALERDGVIVGIAPCFLKNHSYGEYVFDHGWAEAYHRAGGRYYPKLQVSVPFTPATGPRLFAADAATRQDLAEGLKTLCAQRGASSVHITFTTDEQWNELAWLKRSDIQFHWRNNGYASFDAFLVSLASRKRKNIRRERAAARSAGVEIHWIAGSDLREEHWDAFFRFYMDTGSRKWGSPYLTREFFSLIGESMREHVLLIMCRRAGRWIAGALNFIGSDTLYGRNWGEIEHHPCLHFEACYYQAIDFAIAHRLATVEAGAQGEHKLARGYLPVETRSLHWIADPALRKPVERYLTEERRQIAENAEILTEMGPYRHTECKS